MGFVKYFYILLRYSQYLWKQRKNTIVPFVYEEAREYYYRIWQANQKNQVKILEQYRPQQIVIQIESPKKENRKKKQFSFLDEEELGDEE